MIIFLLLAISEREDKESLHTSSGPFLNSVLDRKRKIYFGEDCSSLLVGLSEDCSDLVSLHRILSLAQELRLGMSEELSSRTEEQCLQGLRKGGGSCSPASSFLFFFSLYLTRAVAASQVGAGPKHHWFPKREGSGNPKRIWLQRR